jgi:NTP pyrophosphatase (non-canonical NTP hydrolase)
MTLEEMQKKALEIRDRYAELNKQNGHNIWGGKDYAMGFAGDFGDLMKLIMAKENVRHIDNYDEKLKHELADCLWSIFVLAAQYDVNLNESFNEMTEKLDKMLKENGV